MGALIEKNSSTLAAPGSTPLTRVIVILRAIPIGDKPACSADLTKLTREDYADFCDESCRLLTQTVRQTGDRRCLDIFEYLEKQRAMLNQNPSVTALAGALAAFCGGL